jgi:hypothetical protein
MVSTLIVAAKTAATSALAMSASTTQAAMRRPITAVGSIPDW